MKPSLALAVSAALILLSPGIEAYQAFAQNVAAPLGIPMQGGVAPVAGFASQGGFSAISTALSPVLDIQLNVLPGVANIHVPLAAKAPAVQAVQHPAEAPQAKTTLKIDRLSKQVGAAVASVGRISQAGAETSRGLGTQLESILTQQGGRLAQEETFEPAVDGLGDWQTGRHLARPAGQEIGDSVREHNRLFPAPERQAAEQAPPQAGGRSPVWPRLIAAAIALVPAYFIGWPLLVMMAPVGAINLALTLSLGGPPFIAASAPKRLRQLPGFLLIAQGLAALAAMYFFFTAPPAQVGLLALLNDFGMGALGIFGGWGLVRYLGRAPEAGKSRDDAQRIGAFAGAVAAAAAIGLTLLGLPGLLPAGVKALAYLTSPFLLLHIRNPRHYS